MNRFTKTIFWVSIFWIVTCLFILTAGRFLPFEFSDASTAQSFYVLVGCTFPLAFISILAKPSKSKTLKALIIIIAVISVPFFAFYSFAAGMCGYITDKTLFVNKTDSSLKIIERHYDCGAYDSDMPKYEYFKVKQLTKQILYSKKIDTTNISKETWQRKSSKQ